MAKVFSCRWPALTMCSSWPLERELSQRVHPVPTKSLAVVSTLALLLSGTTVFLYLENRQAAHRLTAEQFERGRLADQVTELESELEAIRLRLTEERNAAARSVFAAQQALEQRARVE